MIAESPLQLCEGMGIGFKRIDDPTRFNHLSRNQTDIRTTIYTNIAGLYIR
ncbi:hypothetical protein [Leptonema illini]|nr:hypothetical protein [Leptonema illini]